MPVLELTKGHLRIKVMKTREQLGIEAAGDAAQALRQIIEEKGECNVIFAAAPSQNEFLAALSRSYVDWSKVNAFHMDEYIGLPADAPQRFGNFLKRSIFDLVPFNSVYYINGDAESAEKEIERYTKLLEEHPADIVFMGIGENGHIAFNNPHVAHFDDTKMMKVVDHAGSSRSMMAVFRALRRFQSTLTP